MVLYYAFGGGLGHLTRANAVLDTLGLDNANFLILTSSRYSDFVFKSENVIELPEEFYSKPDELKYEIETIIKTKKIDKFFIDSFPSGINGELKNLKVDNCKLYYVARLLNWLNYKDYISNFNLHFEATYIIEKLSLPQFNFIKRNSLTSSYLNLKYPNPGNLEAVNQILSKTKKPCWLIVHSGNFNEVQQLYQYASDIAELEIIEPYYIIISQSNFEIDLNSGIQINYYPAIDFFPYTERIFTACGFNSMNQAVRYIDKHYFIPFVRKFDDQFARAKERKLINVRK